MRTTVNLILWGVVVVLHCRPAVGDGGGVWSETGGWKRSVLDQLYVHRVHAGLGDRELLSFGVYIPHRACPTGEGMHLPRRCCDSDLNGDVQGRPSLATENEGVSNLEHRTRTRTGGSDEEVNLPVPDG